MYVVWFGFYRYQALINKTYGGKMTSHYNLTDMKSIFLLFYGNREQKRKHKKWYATHDIRQYLFYYIWVDYIGKTRKNNDF